MPLDDVIDRDATDQPVSKEQPVEKGKGPETETISKSELAALRRERDEARESEKFWAQKAQSPWASTGKDGEKPVVEEKDPEEPDPKNETFVDDIAAKGLSALTERGIPTTKAVREMIRVEATKIANKIARETVGNAEQKAVRDNAIFTKFPELKDQNSELFKQTRIELQELVDLDPSAAKSPAALYSAAKAAKAALDAKAPKRRRDEDDRYDYEGGNEDEDQRRLRVASQGGDRGRGTREVLDDDDLIGPQARAVIAGMGISDKEFLEQQKELGVRDGRGRFQRGRR